MRLALLGLDDQVLAIAEAALAGGEHEIVMVWSGAADAEPAGLDIDRADRSDVLAGVEHVKDWESLLDARAADAILVARSPDENLLAEQLRKLVQAERPLILAHPLGLSTLVYYELSMIAQEQGVVRMLVYLPARFSPAMRHLDEALATEGSHIGKLEQAVFERFTADRSQRAVLDHFARDSDFLHHSCGHFWKLTATAPSPSERGYANLSVHLATQYEMLARWSVHPVEGFAGGRLTIVGSEGKAVLHMPDGADAWRLEIRRPDGTQQASFPTANLPLAILSRLSAPPEFEHGDIDWVYAAKTIEAAEAIPRSLMKSRAIDLHDEEHSEANTFKGLMTSLGCAVLIGGLMILIGAVTAQNLAKRGGFPRVAEFLGKWPALLLALLALFLILQFLLPLARPGRRK